MASTSSNMQLKLWDLGTDHFSYTDLYNNFLKIDAHNHTGGTNGIQIPAGGLAVGSVVETNIATGAVTTTKIADNAVSTSNIASSAVTKAKTSNNVTYSWQSSTTALPSNPTDDQLLSTTVSSKIAANDTGNTVTTYNTSWYFQFASPSQWRFAGGAPLTSLNKKELNVGATSGTTLKLINNTDVVLPYKGAYVVEFGCRGYAGDSSTSNSNISVDGLSEQFVSFMLEPKTAEGTAGSDYAFQDIFFDARGRITAKTIIITSSTNTTYSLYAKTSKSGATITPTIQNAYMSVVPIYITL